MSAPAPEAQPRSRGHVLLLSPAGTGGWRANEAALAASLDRLGIRSEVRRVELGPAARLLRFWALGALLVGWYSRRELRRALREGSPEALIAVNSSSALLLPVRALERRGIPVAIRADCPAGGVWSGPAHAPHRWLERRALRGAALVLSMGPRSTAALEPLASRVAEVPFGVEPRGGEEGGPTEPATVLVYAGDPRQKGLDLICDAWAALAEARGDAVLTVTGVEAERGRKFLAKQGVPEPEGIRWAGTLPRERFLEQLDSAAAFVSASRWEDHGIAQLEALAAGAPLVTTDSRGAYEAGPIACELAPELFCEADPDALAAGMATALAMPAERRRAYAGLAAEALAPYRPARADEALAGALSSLGLATGAAAPTGERTPPRSAG